MQRLYGLVGYPLSHSFSKKYFTEKFLRDGISDSSYELFPIKDASGILLLAEAYPYLRGLNVTIPHKETVLPFLDELDELARKVGAVNCIMVKRDGTRFFLKGYNTDVFGFAQALKPFLESHHQRALILGTGGASRAVSHVLSGLGIECFYASGREQGGNNVFSYKELNAGIIEGCKLIVNTTPLGTFPDIDKCPDLPYEFITDRHFVFDLVYNPPETLLLKKAKEKGALTQNGLSMLQLQAEKAWEIWNG